MSLQWIQEGPAHWDESKESILGGAPSGVFDIDGYRKTRVLPGTWWRVEEDGVVVGYGWMDITWGDAEILLAVGSEHRGRGVGSFILDRLEEEAHARGLNYLYNVVHPTHPDAQAVTRWLERRKFVASKDGLLRRAVRPST